MNIEWASDLLHKKFRVQLIKRGQMDQIYSKKKHEAHKMMNGRLAAVRPSVFSSGYSQPPFVLAAAVDGEIDSRRCGLGFW